MKTEVRKFKAHIDKRGSLVPVEFKDLDFVPKRLFYVTDVPNGCRRGGHSHYETEQILICIKGIIGVKLNDEYFLLHENEYIYVDKGIWDAQDFLTKEDILLVLCSTNYDKNDYINNRHHRAGWKLSG